MLVIRVWAISISLCALCVSVCLQDWVCGRENADQLVHVSPLQVSEGNTSSCLCFTGFFLFLQMDTYKVHVFLFVYLPVLRTIPISSGQVSITCNGLEAGVKQKPSMHVWNGLKWLNTLLVSFNKISWHFSDVSLVYVLFKPLWFSSWAFAQYKLWQVLQV